MSAARVLREWRARMVAFAFACMLCGLPAAAVAVDRNRGADIPKPSSDGAAWTTPAIARLQTDIDALLAAAPTLHGAHVGLLVLDARNSRQLYARNADDAFQPASTLKLLTGSVALSRLGPGFRFRTEALLTPDAATLYLHGGGDPLLGVLDLAALGQTLRTAGVTALASGVRVDASAFEADPYPPGWSWDDLVYDYAPVLSAASIEENVVHLTVTPGAKVGAPVTVAGAPPPFERIADGSAAAGRATVGDCGRPFAIVVNVRATTGERETENTIDLRRDPGGCINLTGAVALGSAPQAIDAAVPSPVWYMDKLATLALKGAGIVVPDIDADTKRRPASPTGSSGGPDLLQRIRASPAIRAARSASLTGPTGPTNSRILRAAEVAQVDEDGTSSVPSGSRIVWTHDGEPLSDLLADLWWPSDNLIAELLLKAIGLHDRGAPGTTEHGAGVERAWLTGIGIDPATVTLADGSGLSTYDRVTPRALVAILQADWNGPFRDLVLDDLPIAGVRGTLEKSFAGSLAERRTFAKTGSVNHTRGLAGYLATVHHGAVTFAWSVDDWMGNDSDLDTLRARVLSRLIGD